MAEALNRSRCGKCGAVLGDCGPEGLCAACLLESAFEETGGDWVEPRRPPALLAFQNYEVLEEIARGGMGVVYRARQVSLNRPVAIKMILGGRLANAAEMKRFRAEAETAAQLQHPNIVAIHEVGEHAGQPFFSMDLVQGRNLAQLVRDEPLPSRKTAGYLRTIAEAVQYAHSRGVLHRDLKPSNILIDENDQPRITDFGLAKRISEPAGTRSTASETTGREDGDTVERVPAHDLTITGQVLGSPSFIPPEQAAGSKGAVGPASDVYSLGAVLYHCVTGRPPFVAETIHQTLRMVAEQEPVSPRLLNASVPRDLETICLKCLEKDPGRRYATAQALAEDLDRFLRNEPIRARPASLVLKVHRWCLRNKPLAVAGTAILALLLVVAIGSPVAWVRINKERKRAEDNAKEAKSEAIRSRQVARFFREMLNSAGPSVARGRDATVLREMLEKTSDRVSRELEDQPAVQGDIYSTIGSTFMDMGDHRRAITSLEQAVRSYHLAFRGDNRNLALTLNMLGFCQSFTQDMARGSNNAWLGLQMARRCGDREILFICLINYAAGLASWGMIGPEAEPSLREAFELQKEMGNDPVGLATAKHMLAGFSTNAGEHEQLLREALAAFQEHLPPGHPRTVQAAFTLGQHLVEIEKFEEAELTLKEALAGFHKTHDPSHPYQSIVLRYLVYALVGQGKMKEAEAALWEDVRAFPTDPNYLSMLIQFRMQHGSPGGANEPLPLDLQTKLEQGEFSCPWAISLLQVGANDKYQEYRRTYLEVAFAHNDFRGKMDIAKILLLYGGDNQDVERSCQLAELAITNATDGDRYAHLEQLNALLDLRRGQMASARRWASRHLAKDENWKPRVCESWFIKALACARLQQSESARDALAKGQAILDQNLPEGKQLYLFAGGEWTLARYLAGEAHRAVSTLPPSSDPANAGARELVDPIDLAIESEARANTLAQKGRWREAAAELARAIELNPTNSPLFLRRGELLGRSGQWQEAASSVKRTIESEPTNTWPYFLLAPTLLRAGEVDGYHQLCRQIVIRFGATTDPGRADTMAKACLIHPSPQVDLMVVAALADTAVTAGQHSEFLPWFQLCKGLAEYRQDHFAGATNWAQKSLASAGQVPERDAAAYIVLAMAQTRLEQTGSAREAFDKGTEIVEKKLPKLDSGDLGAQWQDVLIAHLLLREARTLIQPEGGPGPAPPNPAQP